MSKYPTGFKNDEIHMLFDIGYTYALLERCQHILEILRDDFPECAELVADMKEFKAGRLQTTTELYDAAERLFKEGQ